MMGRLVSGGLSALLLVVLCLFCACAREQQPRLITVSGEAEVRVKPDEAIIHFGIETFHKDLGLAKKHNDERINRVLAIAKKFDIPPGNFWQEGVRAEPLYEGAQQRDYPRGYSVSRGVVFILDDPSRLDEFIEAAFAAGANSCTGVQLRTTRLGEYREEARVLALKAAKDKAKGMAKVLGQRVGRPVAIVEEGYEGGVVSTLPEVEKKIAIGPIGVRARVRVSFALR